MNVSIKSKNRGGRPLPGSRHLRGFTSLMPLGRLQPMAVRRLSMLCPLHIYFSPLKPLLTGRWISLCALGQRAPRFNRVHLAGGTHLLSPASSPLVTANTYMSYLFKNINVIYFPIIIKIIFLFLKKIPLFFCIIWKLQIYNAKIYYFNEFYFNLWILFFMSSLIKTKIETKGRIIIAGCHNQMGYSYMSFFFVKIYWK